MEEKKEFTIPEHIIESFIKKYGEYPCITQTRNVVYSAIDLLLKKNKLQWFYNFFDGEFTLLKEGLIDYSSTYKIMVYVTVNKEEKVYKLFVFSTSENKSNVELLLKGLNKFYTIDIV